MNWRLFHRKPLTLVFLAGIVLRVTIIPLLLGQTASAHAGLARAEPAPNSVLAQPPARVTVWFAEPIEQKFSDVQILDVGGRRVDNGDSSLDRSDPLAMSVTLPPIPNGTYTVAWRNVSAVDGHPVQDWFVFSVGEPLALSVPSPGAGQPLVPSPAQPFLRWFELLSLLTIIGGLSFQLMVCQPALGGNGSNKAVRRAGDLLWARSRRLNQAAAVVFFLASVAQLLLQASLVYEIPLFKVTGSPATSVLTGTDWGRWWVWRTFLVLAAALAPGLVRRFAPPRKPAQPPPRVAAVMPLALACLALLGFSFTSHGGAADLCQSKYRK